MGVTTTPSPPLIELIDRVTIFSLLLTVLLLIIAYAISVRALRQNASKTIHGIFIWHMFDSLIHVILEGSFLYHSLFSISPSGLQRGAAFSTAPMALLWQEYAKADYRWNYGDETVVSLELLTVIIYGPMTAWICYMLAKEQEKVWFWITVVAVGELYGGWMTFCPEWLTGSKNLNTSNPMYMWVYLFFFNTLWVFIPAWILYIAYGEIAGGLKAKKVAGTARKSA